MKKLVLLLAILVITVAFAQDPEDIIVKYDSGYGGNYLTNAISNLWSGCSVTTYDGNTWPSFISGLTGSDWDMCIVAAINYTTFNTSDYQALTNYYNDDAKLHYMNWYSHNTVDSMLESAMGVGNPGSMGFTPNHYVWDSSHDIVQGIDPWTLDMHGWGFGVYHHRYPWTSAHPVTGWSASESAGQAGLVEAENGEGVITGLYASYMGDGQEEALWENILEFIWGGWSPGNPPWVEGMDPDDGDSGVPVDTDIVFHCVDDLSPIETDTIVFTVEDQSRRLGGGALYPGSSLPVLQGNPQPTGEISGTLEIDDYDPLDVVCTFTPDEDLPVDLITCTVDGCLADTKGNEMEEDFVWAFSTGNYGVEETTWGAIKAEFE